MSALAQKHKAINLAQGFPGFNCSDELIERAYHFMKIGMNQYAPMAGALPLRIAIADKILQAYQIALSVDDEICVTAGATEAVFVAIQTAVSVGDEVIILEPAFDIYNAAVKMAGAKPVYVKLNQSDFSINWDDVESKISSKTRLIIINSPHNPTGAIITKNDIEQLAKLVEKYNLLVLSDEVYEHIVFDNQKHYSVLSNDFLRKQSFVVFSLGKTFHVTGWRIGYCVAPKKLMIQFKNRHQYITFAASTPLQLACADFMQDSTTYLSIAKIFEQKRDLFLKFMKGTGFEPIKCSGTYFQLMKYNSISQVKDVEFAKMLTCDFGVASIPISVFYHDNMDSKILRFCFAKEASELENAANKLMQISTIN